MNTPGSVARCPLHPIRDVAHQRRRAGGIGMHEGLARGVNLQSMKPRDVDLAGNPQPLLQVGQAPAADDADGELRSQRERAQQRADLIAEVDRAWIGNNDASVPSKSNNSRRWRPARRLASSETTSSTSIPLLSRKTRARPRRSPFWGGGGCGAATLRRERKRRLSCAGPAVPSSYQLMRLTNWMTRLVFVPVRPVTS